MGSMSYHVIVEVDRANNSGVQVPRKLQSRLSERVGLHALLVVHLAFHQHSLQGAVESLDPPLFMRRIRRDVFMVNAKVRK